MDNAVIAQQGAPRELYERPNSRFLADFIGEANLIQGQSDLSSGSPVFKAEGLALPLPAAATSIAVRPDRITLRPTPDAPFRILRRSFVGASNEYTVAAPLGRTPGDPPHGRAGSRDGRDRSPGDCPGRGDPVALTQGPLPCPA